MKTKNLFPVQFSIIVLLSIVLLGTQSLAQNRNDRGQKQIKGQNAQSKRDRQVANNIQKPVKQARNNYQVQERNKISTNRNVRSNQENRIQRNTARSERIKNDKVSRQENRPLTTTRLRNQSRNHELSTRNENAGKRNDFNLRHERNHYTNGYDRHRKSDHYRTERNHFYDGHYRNYKNGHNWHINKPYWAPTYGYMHTTRNIFLPDYNCYYDLYRGYYLFFDGYAWFYTPNLPWFLVNADWRSVRQVELDDWYDDPYYYNDDDIVVYGAKRAVWRVSEPGLAYNHYNSQNGNVNGYFRIEANF